MKISKREKLLAGGLLITALIVWMVGWEGGGAVPGETEMPLVNSGQIFAQYRRIRPFPDLKDGNGPEALVSTRNIFQFGNRTVPGPSGTLESPKGKLDEKGGDEVENAKSGAGQSAEPAQSQPPVVDFKVIGTIVAGPAHAAVITKSPELFVVRESQRFLDHFILRSVKRKGIVIGYTGFKDELFIPLKKDGGLQ